MADGFLVPCAIVHALNLMLTKQFIYTFWYRFGEKWVRKYFCWLTMYTRVWIMILSSMRLENLHETSRQIF